MSIGYACLVVGVRDTGMKHCLLKNASTERLSQLTEGNLKALDNIMDYNIASGIKLFRISSDLIPFGSSPVNNMKWWELYQEKLLLIGDKIRKNGIRVSMHPGQYTVLNSPDEVVFDRAIQDLNYHAQVLESLKTGSEHKIILHIGGVYRNKEQSIERFIDHYDQLSDEVKKRLVIENDDKSYNISDVLDIGRQLKIPVVFDNLHHAVNSPEIEKSDIFWINECRDTWQIEDGVQKIHYSQQDPEKRLGAHSNSIDISDFLQFYGDLKRSNIDIMLEVKDKNLSAIKCINCISKDQAIKALEIEWSRYKYNVLEKAASSYNEIRKLLKNKKEYPALEFYQILEAALKKPEVVGNAINAAFHVWGYFKDAASALEKEMILKNILDYQNGVISLNTIKRNLWKLAVKYEQGYLLESYYFIL